MLLRVKDDSPKPRLIEDTFERLAEAMRRGNGNQSIVAQLLGVSQSALSHRLKKQSKA
jgi:DNA-binding protein Fis